MLGLLAAIGILGSELPRMAAWPLALVALAHGIFLGRRELRQDPFTLVFPVGEGPARVNGAPVTGADVQWRGPFAFVTWRDVQGCRHRRQFWPDTLAAKARRELRLAMIERSTAPAARSMAP